MSDTDVDALLDAMRTRFAGEPASLEAPPTDLWDRIEAQLDMPSTAQPPDNAGLLSHDSTVTALDHHRRRRRPAGALLAAVAASVVAAIVVGSALTSRSTVVADVALDSLTEGQPPLGRVDVLADDDRNRLDISFETALEADSAGSYELWVIDTEIEGMYSLGTIDSTGAGDSMSFELPEGVSIADFPIVDISFEPDDGVEAHSGDSRYRAIVETT